MKKIASELLVERLIDWGVDTVFGLPGDGINGIMEGLRRHQDEQAKGFATAFLRGQPRRTAIGSTLLHDRFDHWRDA